MSTYREVGNKIKSLITIDDVINYFKTDLKITNVKTLSVIDNEKFDGTGLRCMITYYGPDGVPVEHLRVLFELPYGTAYTLSVFFRKVAIYL